MVDPALLQAYRARLPQRRASDAELIDENAYASEGDSPDEIAPQGLVDRLYQEQLNAEPMRRRVPQSLPTTRNGT